jgi:phage major head subunit gpT-like protein
MDVNQPNIQALDTAFTTAFNTAFTGVGTSYARIAMTVKSTNKTTSYPKLTMIGGMREWLGDRVIERFGVEGFQITNRKFEKTLAVGVDEMDDDEIGLFSQLSSQYGQAAGELPDELVWEQLQKGFDVTHYDGQLFFDDEHPVTDKDGKEQAVSNYTDGAAPAWYLVDDTQVLKPVIFQDRTPAQFTSKTNLTDDNVFFQDEFIWGAKRRCATGFAAWELAHASKAELTPESYAAARQAMLEMRGDKGRKLNLKPSLLVVSAANEGAARDILLSERIGGSTNKWRNTADLHVETRLD